MKEPSGKDLGDYRKRVWWTLASWLWHSLSPHSVCKKSPNLLAALLPLPDWSLKQCWKWVLPCAGKGELPRSIRPKKECIKSYETYFANTFNLNDKGPCMKWVCFPKVLWPFNYLTLTQNKPSEFFECYLLLIISAWQWLMSFVFLCKLNPIKDCPGKGLAAPLFHWESIHVIPFPPQDFCSPCEFVSSHP